MKPPITPETLAALEAAGYAVVPCSGTRRQMFVGRQVFELHKRGLTSKAARAEAKAIYDVMVEAGRLRPSDLEASRDPLTPVTNLGGDDGLVDDRLRPVESAAHRTAREAVEAQSPTTRAILAGRFKVEPDHG